MISPRRDSPFDILSILLQEKGPKEVKVGSPKKSAAKVSLDKNTAANVIQEYWRTYQTLKATKKDTDSSFLKCFITEPQLFHSREDAELDTLHKLMFGRVISEPTKKQSFPFTNSYKSPAGNVYHRWGDLEGALSNETRSLYKMPAEDKTRDKIYIPVTISSHSPVEETLTTIVGMNKEDIKIFLHEELPVAIIEIPLKLNSKIQCQSKLINLGLIATPWQFAMLHAKYPEKKSGLEKEKKKESKEHGFLAFIPEGIAELKTSNVQKQLSVISQSNAPTRLLAASLHDLLNNLPDVKVPKSCLQRIYFYSSIAAKFYKNNYAFFALSVYAVVHELTLVLYTQMQKQKPVVTFEHYKKSVEQHAISYFGLEDLHDKSNQYYTVAAPANAGTHSFFIALQLAKKMKTESGKEPEISYVGPIYFEYKELYFPSGSSSLGLSDIYVISSGPILGEELQQGIDINKLVQDIIAKKPGKPFVIVVDATTGPYSNLQLTIDTIELVERGDLSIIVSESSQKFRLLHTDQAQYGRVFGVCGKNSFADEVIKSFHQNSENDLVKLLDIQVGGFIDICCGKYLEAIKQKHFDSGDLFTEVLEKLNLLNPKKDKEAKLSVTAHKNKFFIAIDSSSKLFNHLSHIVRRPGFGHFTTTIAGNGPAIERLSPTASDEMDNLLEISQLYLLVMLPSHELKLYYYTYLNQHPENLTFSEKVIFLSLFNTKEVQKEVEYVKKYRIENKFQFLLNAKNILDQCKEFKGRVPYNRFCKLYFEQQRSFLQSEDKTSVYYKLFKLSIHNKLSDKENTLFRNTINQIVERMLDDSRDDLIKILETLLKNHDQVKPGAVSSSPKF